MVRGSFMRLWPVLLALSWCFSAHAVQSLDFTIHEEYTSTRALGMGNAFTAVVDDQSAIFYNPAALARRRRSKLRMFLRAGTDADTISLYNDINDATKNSSDSDQIDAITQIIEKHYGDHFFFRAPTLGAMWVWHDWGIAFLPADLSVDIDDHQQIGPTLDVNAYLDSTLAVSYAHQLHWFHQKNLSWGATFKAVHRVFDGKSILAAQLVDGEKVFQGSDADEGLTFDMDVGTLWTPEVPHHGFFRFLRYMRPTFAIVGRNLLDYGFKTNFHLVDPNSGEPPKLQRRFDFGSKFELPHFWVFTPKIAADIRDVGHPNWTLKKGYHLGAEFYWRMYHWWQGHWNVGLNQGYWTAGFGAKLAWFQIDLASWGEEVGTSSNPKESRRYIAELSLDF